jgi:serine/threonine protein kinase
MELVTGGDLAQYVSKDKLLPVADALQIGFKCCGALDYAFKEGIVHRDIKPANILISRGTEVKISDFGAAFLKKSQAVQTAAMGSPFYMSPEQIEGKELTFHSDMFSMGVVLYELLTGTRPFLGDTLEALVQKILQQDPPAPSTLRQGLPKAVDAVVLTALMKRPAHRHATWADFANMLSEAVKLVLPPEAIADTEKFTTLKKVELLSNLPDAELWEIVNAGVWSRVPKITNIVREGEAGANFYFLAEGQAKVTLQGKLLNLVNELEFVGEMAWILGGDAVRHATVVAMTDLLMAEYTPDALAEMTLGAQLHLTRAVARNLVDRLALANSRLAR